MRYLPLLLLLTACSSTKRAPEAPGPVASSPAAPSAEASREESFPVRPTLRQVLDRSERSPVVLAARAEIAREEGSLDQAGRAPNPVLRASTEQFDTDDLADGPGKRSVGLYQRFEIGGKRGARKDSAGERIEEAAAREQVRRLEVAGAAAAAHQDALASQGRAALREEALRTSRELLALEEQLVRTGRLPETSVVPLRAEVGRLRVALSEERNRHRTALRRLEGVLSLPAGSLEGVEGGLLDERELPPVGTSGLFSDNPEVAARRAAEEAALADVRRAETLAVPDVTVGLAYQEGEFATGDRGPGLGLFLELPLPVLDRNQGGIAAAEAEVRRAQALTRDTRARIDSAYAERMEGLLALRENREAYLEEIVPARERLSDLARVSFEAGRATRAEVFRTHLELLEARTRLLTIEGGIALRCVDALALLGRPPGEWEG